MSMTNDQIKRKRIVQPMPSKDLDRMAEAWEKEKENGY